MDGLDVSFLETTSSAGTGCGKTTWADKHMALHPTKGYMLLSIDAILRSMRVRDASFLFTYTHLITKNETRAVPGGGQQNPHINGTGAVDH